MNSQAKSELWWRPRLIEVRYPAAITDVRDRDDWLKAMMLDRRLTARTRLILARLALHLNLKAGRCDPSEELLGAEVALSGSRDVVKRTVRRALAQAESVGWISRTHRHGGNVKEDSQSNQYRLITPNDVTTRGHQSPLEPGGERTKRREDKIHRTRGQNPSDERTK